MNGKAAAIIGLVLTLLAGPALAQFTTLDDAGDAPAPPPESEEIAPGAPEPVCGDQPFTIARMNWPSAMLLAEIHALVLAAEFDCEARVMPGDPGGTASSMGSTGQPAMAPELWVNRIADVWNGAMEAQMVRSAAPAYAESSFEGWYMPVYLAGNFTATPSAAALAEALPLLSPGQPMRFISCPIDWACSIINRNLVRAHGLDGLVELVEPANRLEMDRLIAEGVSRREPFLFYYWQPNAVLAQLEFTALDMGAYDEAAAKCLASRICAEPQPSAFPPDLVIIALAERVFADMPQIAGYFQRATLPLAEMDAMLAQLNLPGATPETVAKRFVAERADIWRAWIGDGTP
ncbi:glycine betaine ABC transporter substrate-binding protein [Devosia sp. YIM 151766]|uniref:glycine betaine ABC transporter substrate-binding protein n=1 Tax=Devosia sp. YIM 151766 TaxID=3017325 RepID=UPI00255C44CA|nr:glycine betaine ABC transporter substrate-binding protein [Devosia sp. YIM 151766]WIY52679.1 glycine betaine ABC transporter substrate-binding protein [Devosia sp. YIM 151766]